MDIALEFAEAAASVSDDAALGTLVDDVANQLGFRHFALVHHLSFAAENPQFVSIDNYPDAWAEEFVGGGLFLEDPVLQASTRTGKGFRWDDVADLLPSARRTDGYLNAASATVWARASPFRSMFRASPTAPVRSQ